MGIYINKGNTDFRSSRNSEYIDKSGLIAVVNETLFTNNRMSCATRCRRFGKSMAANMLCAYYDRSCDSRALFEDLEIAQDPSFEKYLNKLLVIKLDMTNFTTRYKDDLTIVDKIQEALKKDVLAAYPDCVEDTPELDFMDVLTEINQKTGDQFFMVIDEWDAICREFDAGTKAMDSYVNWLRRMFKGGNTMDVFAGVYMTGILPIKKYKTESALNNFREYSMILPRKAARYFGFTPAEVQMLCLKHGMDFDELKRWYDGYQIGSEPSIFNPNSVIEAFDAEECDSYWATTGAFDNVKTYIQMNFDGLRQDIISMIGGGRCKVNTTSFSNDMSIINCKDDVFTVLIHLGYLSYDKQNKECYIPNKEVGDEMINAVNANGWTEVTNALQASERLLQLTLRGEADEVAALVEKVHDQNTSILTYNDENSLACVLTLAYYYAKNEYVLHRELATGKGFADLVFIPRNRVEKPAIILELKYNKDAETAIEQIHRKEYQGKVLEYSDNLLLVGINYDRETKKHSCFIEKYYK